MRQQRAEQTSIADLIQQLQHPNWRVRRDAVVALGRTKRVEAIPPLLATLGDFDRQDEDSKVNMCAGTALCEIGEPALVPLIDALQKQTDHPHDARRRYWVADALGIFGDRRAVEPLIAALADPEIRAGAAEALGRLGDPQALEPLRRLYAALTTTDGYVYRAIGWAIRDIQTAIAPHPLPLRKEDAQLLAALLDIAGPSDETMANNHSNTS
jgi:HEAT repeat protein